MVILQVVVVVSASVCRCLEPVAQLRDGELCE